MSGRSHDHTAPLSNTVQRHTSARAITLRSLMYQACLLLKPISVHPHHRQLRKHLPSKAHCLITVQAAAPYQPGHKTSRLHQPVVKLIQGFLLSPVQRYSTGCPGHKATMHQRGGFHIAGCGGKHHQGDYQGLRHWQRGPRLLPALQRLSRRGCHLLWAALRPGRIECSSSTAQQIYFCCSAAEVASCAVSA